MGISIYKIKKWVKMLTGNSISHVNQGVGRLFSRDEVRGYYNDLTEKVTKREAFEGNVPVSFVDTGEKIYFPIEIFQYGLAAYDLFLETKDPVMLEKVISCADWAVENQKENGAWVTFAYQNEDEPYSSMAQGEAISLLIRAYKETSKNSYLSTIENAMSFLCTSLQNGGVLDDSNGRIVFREYTFLPLVLNGWIFSIWGIWDYCLYFKNGRYEELLKRTLNSLEELLPEFDTGYWSLYTIDGRICSPFYHKLHIAQLRVMGSLTSNPLFISYADKWEGYQNNKLYSLVAFIKKVIQKLMER